MANNSAEPNAKRARNSDTDDDGDSDSEIEEGEDRLSDLPDGILIHMMTFLSTKDVVCTAILSRRWKDLCKYVRTSLVLRTSDFKFQRMKRFSEAVSNFLLLRDGSVPLLNVDLHHASTMRPDILKSVSEYAVMHNVERLRLRANTFLHLSPSVFTSQTLTSLHLSSRGHDLLPKTLRLGALTSLHLNNFAFCAAYNDPADHFSSCVKLKTLVIENCVIKNSRILCISNATLVSLTIHSKDHAFGEEIVLSTPSLRSFSFFGVVTRQLSATSNLSSLKQVTIDFDTCVERVGNPKEEMIMMVCLQSAFIIIEWLKVFANIRSLTICSRTLKVLSLIPELLNTGSPRLDNLRLLIVKLRSSLALLHKQLRATNSEKANFRTTLVHAGVVNYLIQNSPFAEVNIIKQQCYGTKYMSFYP
ncbi:hypothetical protein PIB30_010781 [Stylosanthes scabra]|uniref:F-box domain-containing protein n=1 Tax=Stylosanthes scabra TaxID=79078 RepID=A0ABU6Z625_9FABA|nr:hypothetical protein [Stylosanthes scabra]